MEAILQKNKSFSLLKGLIDPKISLIMLEDDKLITEKRWFSRVPQWVPRWSGPRENT